MTIQSDYNASSYAGSLSFTNNVLSETGNAVVTLTNTDNQDGSDGDVIISGTVYVSGISAGIGANGTAGTGQILSEANATIDGDGGTVILSAGSGIGSSQPELQSTSRTSRHWMRRRILAASISKILLWRHPDDPERLRVEREHRCDVVGARSI